MSLALFLSRAFPAVALISKFAGRWPRPELVVKGNVQVKARHYGARAELVLDGSTDVM